MNLTGKKILIAEDEPDLRELLVEIFADCGAEVLGAENGTVAFALVKQNSFDAIITDVRMPGGGGVELIKNINSHYTNQVRPPVFICSAFNDLTPEDLVNMKVIEGFAKPFKRKAMIETVARALGLISE
jgi:DNA-binding NtrC family response regulator